MREGSLSVVRVTADGNVQAARGPDLGAVVALVHAHAAPRGGGAGTFLLYSDGGDVDAVV